MPGFQNTLSKIMVKKETCLVMNHVQSQNADCIDILLLTTRAPSPVITRCCIEKLATFSFYLTFSYLFWGKCYTLGSCARFVLLQASCSISAPKRFKFGIFTSSLWLCTYINAIPNESVV